MFNKTEYNEAPLARRSAPFKNRIVVPSEGMIVTQSLNPTKALEQDEFILKELATQSAFYINLQRADSGPSG